MNLKELIFGEGVHTGGSGVVYRDSVQAWLPIKNIIGGVVITKDNRFVKIMEVLPVNIYLKSAIDRQNIISSFASYLQIAPDELQMIARTLPADTQAYVEQMQRYAEQEENEACREMIEDNIREIGHGIAGGAMRHRFFLVFQYEPSMRAKRNTVQAIIQRLNEEADTARRYLDLCELEVLEPQYSDNFVLKLLYEILNKKTSQRVRLPEGVFDHPRTGELIVSAKETEVNPFFGAEERHPVGSRRFAMISGKYGGGVFCNLPDGVTCMCNYSYQHEDADFMVGEHVMLMVQRYDQEKLQMYGKIMSKW